MPNVQPKRIGPYRIDGLLGSGGMGQVFLAYDERLKRPVAIKQLRDDAQSTLERRTRLRREAQAVALLNHPAIVQVHDIVTVDGLDHVVMEYVDGMPLCAFLEEQNPQLTEILQLAQDIAEGLAEAHSKGIVHRDLKSENILVTQTGRAKILDFGLAKQLWLEEDEDSVSVEGSLIGTSVAMSPEQAQGRKVDHRSDLFSFGILLFEMLHGCKPFVGDTPLSTLHQIINDPPKVPGKLNPDLPEDLLILVDRLLEKDPDRRPQHAMIVAETLDRLRIWALNIESGEPGTGTGSQPIPILVVPGSSAGQRIEESSSPSSMWRRWSWAVLALVIVSSLVAFWWGSQSPAEPIRVAVSKVQVEGELPASLFVPEATRTALLRGLTSLRGVTTLDPVDGKTSLESPKAYAEALATDEVLRVQIRSIGSDQARVEIRRVSTPDGHLVAALDFDVPPNDLRLLATAVIQHLHELYSEFEPRPEMPELEVRREDYQRFFVLRRWALGGGRHKPIPDIIEQLKAIRESSPRFLESYLLEARLARHQFLVTQEPSHLDHAAKLLEKARDLSPGDPRPVVRLIEVALADQDLDRVEHLIGELERMEPGDVELLLVRAQLEEKRGNIEQARRLLEQAIERKSALAYLMQLADFELRLGSSEDAQQLLKAIIERAPEHYDALSKLAQLELQGGDPERARELYERLVERAPDATILSNLGLAQLLLRQFAEATISFQQANQLRPENPLILLNLADAQYLRGREEEARRIYQQALDLIELREAEGRPLSWELLCSKSQILAHLGEDEEAIRLAEDVFERSSGDHRAALSAALVYAVLNRSEPAREYLDKALQGGSPTYWENLPWFDLLKENV